MINIKELRVGNLIECKTKIIGDYWDCQRLLLINFNDIANKDDSIASYRPIPLTEEWLLKLGFECEKLRFNWYSINTMARIEIVFEEIPNGLSLYQDGKSIDTKHNCCKYVHQLQNLYFALTGKELGVNN